MKKEAIIKTLIPWNFWEKEPETGKTREGYIKETLNYLKTNKIATLVGIRRAGKSFIARQIVKSLDDKKNSLIINFEEVRFDEELDKKFLIKVYDAYLSILKPEQKPLIVLDEVQEVKGWEKFVRSLDEKKEAFLIVSGSSAKIMSEELATLLTGRTLKTEVFPLSFREFLKFKEVKFKDKFEFIKQEETIKDCLKEYLSFGGFPEVVLEGNKELKLKILRGYYTDIINKDIIRRFKVRRIDKLERIAFYYLSNFSCPITFNRIGKFLKFSEKIVEIYSKYIETSKLIFFLKRFSTSVKEQENSPRKIYLMDIGFGLLGNILFADKNSKIYENVVAIQLLKEKGEKNVFYWKDQQGREVDFVVKEGTKVKQLINVCYNLEKEETKERELRSLVKASEELKCENLLVITEDYSGEEMVKGKTREEQSSSVSRLVSKKIKFIPLWQWLLEE